MNDPEIQRRFTALRSQEERQAPRFERMWAAAARAQLQNAPGLSRGGRFALAGCFAGCVLLGCLLWPGDSGDPSPQTWDAQLASLEREISTLELSAWRAPSDFLLAANP